MADSHAPSKKVHVSKKTKKPSNKRKRKKKSKPKEEAGFQIPSLLPEIRRTPERAFQSLAVGQVIFTDIGEHAGQNLRGHIRALLSRDPEDPWLHTRCFTVGVELDKKQGLHSGKHRGIRLFSCKPGHGLYALANKVFFEPTPAVFRREIGVLCKAGAVLWRKGRAASHISSLLNGRNRAHECLAQGVLKGCLGLLKDSCEMDWAQLARSGNNADCSQIMGGAGWVEPQEGEGRQVRQGGKGGLSVSLREAEGQVAFLKCLQGILDYADGSDKLAAKLLTEDSWLPGWLWARAKFALEEQSRTCVQAAKPPQPTTMADACTRDGGVPWSRFDIPTTPPPPLSAWCELVQACMGMLISLLQAIDAPRFFPTADQLDTHASPSSCSTHGGADVQGGKGVPTQAEVAALVVDCTRHIDSSMRYVGATLLGWCLDESETSASMMRRWVAALSCPGAAQSYSQLLLEGPDAETNALMPVSLLCLESSPAEAFLELLLSQPGMVCHLTRLMALVLEGNIWWSEGGLSTFLSLLVHGDQVAGLGADETLQRLTKALEPPAVNGQQDSRHFATSLISELYISLLQLGEAKHMLLLDALCGSQVLGRLTANLMEGYKGGCSATTNQGGTGEAKVAAGEEEEDYDLLTRTMDALQNVCDLCIHSLDKIPSVFDSIQTQLCGQPTVIDRLVSLCRSEMGECSSRAVAVLANLSFHSEEARAALLKAGVLDAIRPIMEALEGTGTGIGNAGGGAEEEEKRVQGSGGQGGQGGQAGFEFEEAKMPACVITALLVGNQETEQANLLASGGGVVEDCILVLKGKNRFTSLKEALLVLRQVSLNDTSKRLLGQRNVTGIVLMLVAKAVEAEQQQQQSEERSVQRMEAQTAVLAKVGAKVGANRLVRSKGGDKRGAGEALEEAKQGDTLEQGLEGGQEEVDQEEEEEEEEEENEEEGDHISVESDDFALCLELLLNLAFDDANRSRLRDADAIALFGTVQALASAPRATALKAAEIKWLLETHVPRGMKGESEKRALEEKLDLLAGKQLHVMISYSWAQQQLVLRLSDALKAAGAKIWIDVDEMSGSTLEAMAEAVEGALVIIMCVSSHYKDSANCRLEAEWALTCRKPIIPVMVEEGYRADGWLGCLMGTKLFYDIAQQRTYEASLDGIVRELKKVKALEIQGRGPIPPPLSSSNSPFRPGPSSSSSPTTSPTASASASPRGVRAQPTATPEQRARVGRGGGQGVGGVAGWSVGRVGQWLQGEVLAGAAVVAAFAGQRVDGRGLLRLAFLQRNRPEECNLLLRERLGLGEFLGEQLAFSFELEQLLAA